MKKLYVLYDLDCQSCGQFCWWLSQQPGYLDLKFIPLQSPEVTSRFPGLAPIRPSDGLVVISDDGGVFQGPRARVMAFYALRKYRETAMWLAHPALLLWARKACELIAGKRLNVSHWRGREEQLGRFLADCSPELLGRKGIQRAGISLADVGTLR